MLGLNRGLIFRIAVILLSVAIVACVVVSLIASAKLANEHTSREAALEELYREKAKLESDYNRAYYKVFTDENNKVVCGANVSLIFLDLDRVLYDKVYPTVKTKSEGVEMSGVFCFSPEELPGLDGKITKEQFDLMVKDSKWDTAIFWEGGNFQYTDEAQTAITEYIELMRGILADAGIPMPSSFVFKKNAYQSRYQNVYNDVLTENGFKHIVHHGEGENLDLMEISGSYEMFRPGAVAWKADFQQKYFIQRIVATGGCSALEVSFKPDDRELYYNTDNPDHNGSFGRMLTFIGEYVTRGELNVMNFSDAWKLTLEYRERVEELQVVVENERSAIMAEIKKINDEINKKHAEAGA